MLNLASRPVCGLVLRSISFCVTPVWTRISLHIVGFQLVLAHQTKHRIDRAMGGIAGRIPLYVDAESANRQFLPMSIVPLSIFGRTGRRMGAQETGLMLNTSSEAVNP